MKERLKLLRKTLRLTQEEFAVRIGIKRNSYANYEIGRNKPIDAVVYSICREYRVSEKWLRTGEGEMFLPQKDEEKAVQWIKDIFTDEDAVFQQRLVLMLSEFSPEQWKTIRALTGALTGTEDKNQN